MDWDLWPAIIARGRWRADLDQALAGASAALLDFTEAMARVQRALTASMPTLAELQDRVRAVAEATRTMTP